MANKVDDNFKYDFFISYCHKNKQIVHKVHKKLKTKYKIWIDINVTKELYDEIANGIEKSKIFVCFVSNEYCESTTCRKEIKLAYESKKLIFPIMLEKRTKEAVSLIIAGLYKFMACKPPKVFEPWSNDLYEELENKIEIIVSNGKIGK